MAETAADRRARRDARKNVKPGPKKRAPERSRPVWQTVLIGLALVAGAFAVAFVLTGDGPPERTETAPVEISGQALSPIPSDGSGDASVGADAPSATGVDFDGEAVDLLADDGGTVVVFLAHWCPHCQAEVPRIVDHLGGQLPEDVRLVGVVTATDPGQGNYPPSAWLEAEDWPFDVLVDSQASELGDAYGVGSYPAFVAVGPDGTVQLRGSGELSTDGLDAVVEAARGNAEG
jgi:cytochrome c biogenesis protein CcmG/thiol:disulfide interchange protein DsbE